LIASRWSELVVASGRFPTTVSPIPTMAHLPLGLVMIFLPSLFKNLFGDKFPRSTPNFLHFSDLIWEVFPLSSNWRESFQRNVNRPAVWLPLRRAPARIQFAVL